ncbi:phosphate acyltransferase PlsX [Hydrogenovibrio sp. 3SP14C1]|uniref:phosphate acyltransferase PlsX n=1 Tax=Hydrogenovibrio sp. 3SP14C1 TaxID=3038774 RepID=UPI002416CADB|nr:phosphate acyltransferase PlsX [Hydrogenovibrio sp. 3SP14C1]MDG4813063.1 phosphate acyltransferase PlsX [Hydrogenovibrio sp. 3SP14C1]
MSIKIAIDAMGGDHGIKVTVPASLEALSKFSDISIVLVGNQSLIEAELANHKYDQSRLSVEHADQVVEMDDLPSKALRNKRKSSMRIALNLVKEDVAQACVSAGNTGALMAVSKFVLKTLPGIDRPAICTQMPTMKGHVHVLDLGANVGADGKSLAQFAVMGSALAQAVDNNARPRVGLLNIGEEEIKGHQRIKDANEILKSSDAINYIGYVEGDEIYKGDVDIVSCDGFDGNIALKSSEGVAKMIAFYLREAFKKNLLTKLAGLVVYPVLKAFKEKVDPRRYNGASFLGLRKIVIKSHGGADAFSFYHAIAEARLEVNKNVPELIATQVKSILDTQRSDDTHPSE